MSPWMSVKECAKHLRPEKPPSIKTVYRWAKRGLIPAHKLNGFVMFNRSEIDAHIASTSAEDNQASLTEFEKARIRLRSLKNSSHRQTPDSTQQRRTANGN